MSERDEQGPGEQPQGEGEAFDARVSAAMDDALDPAAREALDREIASNPERAARASALRGVDAALRTLAEAPIAEDRLERNLTALKARLAQTDANDSTDVIRLSWLRRAAVPILAAAAAALALYLLLPQLGDPGSTSSPEIAAASSPDTPDARESVEGAVVGRDIVRDGGSTRPSDEAIAVALGYGEDPAMWQLAPGVPIDDLEIIEELDLLEYLATRETEGRG